MGRIGADGSDVGHAPTPGPLPGNLSLRPAGPQDAAFLEGLYRSTREDLWLADAEADAVEALIEMQYRAQVQGYGQAYPDAFTLVVEHAGERIGRVMVHFGSDTVRVLHLALLPRARGHGYGADVLRALQQAAARTRVRLTLSTPAGDPRAVRFYGGLGFRRVGGDEVADELAWFPPSLEDLRG